MSYVAPNPSTCTPAEWTIHRGIRFPFFRYDQPDVRRWVVMNAILADIDDRRGLNQTVGSMKDHGGYISSMVEAYRIQGDPASMVDRYLEILCEQNGAFSSELAGVDDEIIQEMKEDWKQIIITVDAMELPEDTYLFKRQFISDVKTVIENDPAGENGNIGEYKALQRGAKAVLSVLDGSCGYPGYQVAPPSRLDLTIGDGLVAMFDNINS